MDTRQKQIVDLLRQHLQLPPEVSDEKILEQMENSFLYARANLTIEVAEMKATIRNALPRWMQRVIAS